MFLTNITCSYCNIPAKDSYRAFFIRLFPGRQYLIMCDGCLAWERRHLRTESPGLAEESSSIFLGEKSLQRLSGSMRKALRAAAHRSIEKFSLPRIHDLPIISTLFRSYRRFS